MYFLYIERNCFGKIITQRDERDSSRSVAPLRKADDAIVLDNSAMSLEETANTIVSLVTTGLCYK